MIFSSYDNTPPSADPAHPLPSAHDVHDVSSNGNSSYTTRPQEEPLPHSDETASVTPVPFPAEPPPQPHYDHHILVEEPLPVRNLTRDPPSEPSSQTRTRTDGLYPALSPNKTTNHAKETVSLHSDCDALPTIDSVSDESDSPLMEYNKQYGKPAGG